MIEQSAWEFLESRSKFGVKLGLNNMKALLDFLGHPERNLKYIHIAGTNGKGSTSMTLTVLLNQLGFKVGLYTSPFVYDFFERFRVFKPYSTRNIRENFNLGNMPEAYFNRYMEKIQNFCSLEQLKDEKNRVEPTYFEVLTALAFLYFQEESCDYVVLEVGLGGRYDATNVIESALYTVITALSYDHKHILGNTLSEIAFEKAGILKPNTALAFYDPSIRFVFSDKQASLEELEDYHQAKQSVLKEAKKNNSPVLLLSKEDVLVEKKAMTLTETVFKFRNYHLKTSLVGEHQAYNISLALLAFLDLVQQETRLKQAWINVSQAEQSEENFLNRVLSYLFWPCRMEVMEEKPLFIYDGAHNEDGSLVLSKNLNHFFRQQKVDYLLGILEDKEVDKMLQLMLRDRTYQIENIYLVQPESERALSLEKLKEKILNLIPPLNIEFLKTDTELLAWFKARTKQSHACIGFGSLYLGKRIKNCLERYRKEDSNV